MLTTKILDPATAANPKPVTGFDYAGQPMKPGSHYNGRPEHMANPEHQTAGASELLVMSRTRKRSKWTPEKRAAFAERMRNYWLNRKAKSGTEATHETPA